MECLGSLCRDDYLTDLIDDLKAVQGDLGRERIFPSGHTLCRPIRRHRHERPAA